MYSKEEAKEKVTRLIDEFNNNPRKDKLTEEETRHFISKLFEILGWDFTSGEVTQEEKVLKGFVDYGFRLNNVPVMFIEAKKSSENLINPNFYNQVTDYAWHKATTNLLKSSISQRDGILTLGLHIYVRQALITERVPCRLCNSFSLI